MSPYVRLKILWGYFFLYIKEKDNKKEPSKYPFISTYIQKCMQWPKWQKWRKIASLWQFELDDWRLAILAKLAILGKIARGLAKMAKNVLAPRRLPILAKYSSFLSMLTGGQYGFESWCTVAICNNHRTL